MLKEGVQKNTLKKNKIGPQPTANYGCVGPAAIQADVHGEDLETIVIIVICKSGRGTHHSLAGPKISGIAS